MNVKINIIHERALRNVCQDDTSNFEKLLNMDNSVKIHTRNLQVLATVMFKLKNGIATLEIFQIAHPKYNLGSKREFKSHNVKTFFFGTKS